VAYTSDVRTNFSAAKSEIELLQGSVLTIPPAGNTLPLINGTATIGVSASWAHADHVHPTDTSRAAATALASYLPLAGGTVTGNSNFNGINTFGSSNVFTGTGNAIDVNNSARVQTLLNIGTTTIGGAIWMNGPAGNARSLRWNTAGVVHWQFGLNAAAESGGNVGADMSFSRYDDTGVAMGAAIQFIRSTGLVNIFNGLSLTSNTVTTNTDNSKHLGLFGTTAGINVNNASARQNYVSTGANAHYFVVGATDAISIDGNGLNVIVGGVSGRSGAAAPTTTQLPAGKSIVWKNTTDATVKLYYNDGGTMRSVTLA
jgi:hypothetical protein